MRIKSLFVTGVVFSAGVATGGLLHFPRAAGLLATPAVAATFGPARSNLQKAICPPPGSGATPAMYDPNSAVVVKYECYWGNMIQYLCPPGFQFAEGNGDFNWLGGGAANVTGMFWHCTQIKVARR